MDFLTNITYCRLCAEATVDLNKVISFEENWFLKEKILSFNNTLLIIDENLPKTVCLPCIGSLDTALQFVNEVQKAQDTLRNIFKLKGTQVNVKKELPEVIECEVNISNDLLKSVTASGESGSENGHLNTEKVDQRLEIHEHTGDSMADNSEHFDSDENYSDGNTSDLKDTENPLSECNKDKNTWEQYSWLCRICETSFPTFGQLTSHSKEEHTNCSTFKCTDCKRGSVKLHVFVAHVKEHRKYLQKSCHYCFKYIPNRTELKHHMQSHITSKNYCLGCHMSFSNADDLYLHIQRFYAINGMGMRERKRPEGERNVCDLCDKEFKNRHNLLVHNQKYHKRHRYTCEQCGQSFGYNHQLKSHILKKHTERVEHQCKICNSVLKDFNQLRRHLLIHNNAKEYPCQECNKVFRLKSGLSFHVRRVHSNVELHICNICGKGYKESKTLKDHQRTHTGEKPYECTICQYKFNSWANYRRHMVRKHDTNISKRKITPAGTVRIDPNTGEFGELEKSLETEQWMKSILQTRADRKHNEPEPSSSHTDS